MTETMPREFCSPLSGRLANRTPAPSSAGHFVEARASALGLFEDAVERVRQRAEKDLMPTVVCRHLPIV